jgi:hypothetical protein
MNIKNQAALNKNDQNIDKKSNQIEICTFISTVSKLGITVFKDDMKSHI